MTVDFDLRRIPRRWLNAGAWGLKLAFSRSAGLARTLLIAWLLAPAEASLGFLSMSLGRGAVAVFETGSREVVITSRVVTDRLLGSAFAVEVAKGVFFGGALVGLGLLREQGTDREVFLWSAAIPLSLGLLSPRMAVWEREETHARIVWVLASGNLVGLLVTGALLLGRWGWQSMPIGLAAGHLTAAALSHWLSSAVALRVPSLAEVWAFLRRGIPFTVIGIATYLGTFGLDLVIAGFGAVASVATFRVASTLVQTIVGTLPGVIIRASLSADARAHREGGRPGQAVIVDLVALAVVTGGTLAASLFCVTALPSVAIIVLGDRWSATSLVLPAVTLLVVVRTLTRQLGVSLVASGIAPLEARVRLVEAALVAMAFAATAASTLAGASLAGALVTLCGLAGRLIAVRNLSPKAAGSAFRVLLAGVLPWSLVAAPAFFLARRVIDDRQIAAQLLLGTAATVLGAVAIVGSTMRTARRLSGDAARRT